MQILKVWDVLLPMPIHLHAYYLIRKPGQTIAQVEELLAATHKQCMAEPKTLVLLDSPDQYPAMADELKRQAVLAKLSDEERRVLGFS